MTAPTTRTLARELDLELLYLSRASEYAIASGRIDEAREYLEAFINIARSNPNRDYADRFELLYELRNRLIEHGSHVGTSDSFERAELVRALPADFADIMERLNRREDCASQQFSWYGHVLAGDRDSANQIASELWDKGSRGLALSFMAKQLGISHPPESK